MLVWFVVGLLPLPGFVPSLMETFGDYVPFVVWNTLWENLMEKNRLWSPLLVKWKSLAINKVRSYLNEMVLCLHIVGEIFCYWNDDMSWRSSGIGPIFHPGNFTQNCQNGVMTVSQSLFFQHISSIFLCACWFSDKVINSLHSISNSDLFASATAPRI